MIKKNTEKSICHKAKDEEGLPYRTIARNVGVNYRNVYDWIKKYRKYDGLDDGIRNKKRKNGGIKPVISSDRNKQMIKLIKKITDSIILLFSPINLPHLINYK
jgi:transposase